MEIFVDLARIAEGQPEPVIPGIDLNLSGLVNFNDDDPGPDPSRTPLKTEPELSLPAFNPVEYFDQIQKEFSKIRMAQESFRLSDDLKTFQQVQQNTNTAIDPLAAYLEKRFNKIETITSNKSEIRELIKGTSDNRLGGTPGVINNQLKLVEEIKEKNSIDAITQSIGEIVNLVSAKDLSRTVENNSERVITTQLNTVQDLEPGPSQVDSKFTIEKSVGLLAELAGLNSPGANLESLPNPTKDPLAVTNELPPPNFEAASLSALQRIADSNQILSAAAPSLTTNTSQVNSNIFPGPEGQSQSSPGPEVEPKTNMMVLPGQSGDLSSMYLVQMLNLLKSGQVKVKLS